jgi:hypothetical protein
VRPVRPPRQTPQRRRTEPTSASDKVERDPGGTARHLYNCARSVTRETPPWLYLNEVRGLPFDFAPTTIRYLPANPPRHEFAAMVLPIGLPEEPEPGRLIMTAAAIVGIHLTLLKADGSKADRAPVKRRIGRDTVGAPIVIAPVNDLLGIVMTEGIEDAVAFHLATGLGAWAAGGATFMPALADAVPKYINLVTVASHPEPDAQRNAEELAVRLGRRGIVAEIQLIDQSHKNARAAA